MHTRERERGSEECGDWGTNRLPERIGGGGFGANRLNPRGLAPSRVSHLANESGSGGAEEGLGGRSWMHFLIAQGLRCVLLNVPAPQIVKLRLSVGLVFLLNLSSYFFGYFWITNESKLF